MPQTVVQLAPLYAPHVGGVERHVERVSAQLIKQGWQVAVVTLWHDANLPLKEKINGVAVYRLPVGLPVNRNSFFQKTTYKLRLWWEVSKHWKLLKNADVVQIHDVFWWLLPFLPIVLNSRRFITFHGYESNQPGVMARNWHQLADRLSAGSLGIGGFHEKWYGVKPTLTAWGATDVVSKSISNRPPSNKIKKAIFIGRLASDVGAVAYVRGWLDWIDSLQLSEHALSAYQLDLYGEGQQRIQIEKLSTTRQAGRTVHLHGDVPNAARLLPSYDVAFVSRYLAIIEALSLSLPVMAHYDSPIKHDYLTITPFHDWITMAGSTAEITTALQHHSISSSATTVAQNWARAQTWEQLAECYLKLWTPAAPQRGHSSV